MGNQPLEFIAPPSTSEESFTFELAARLPIGAWEAQALTAWFLDTFDWRLLRAGQYLRVERGETDTQLIWGSIDESRPPITLPWGSPALPRVPAELPPSALRDALGTLVELRALLPWAELRLHRRTAPLLDDEEKTLARVRLQRAELMVPGHDPVALGERAAILPLRGYPEAEAALRRCLAEEMGLASAQLPLLNETLERLGVDPFGYNPKLDFRFHPEMNAGAVLREVQLHLLDNLEANLPGARADLDSEFLHDLRVAVRRARSLLSQVKEVFPVEALAHFKEQLGWIGRITGPCRDMDVYLLKFDDYRRSLPAEYQPHLDPLHDFLHHHKRTAHHALVREFASPAFRKLLREWRIFLTHPDAPAAAPPAAAAPIGSVAGRRTWKMYRRLKQEAEALRPESPPEALHELRKSCKKLRYLMECFQSLYPKEEIQPLIKAVKGLQEHLGDYQDLAVQAEKLRELAHQMAAEAMPPADTLLAMGMLVDGLLRRRQALRHQLDPQVAEFIDEGNSRRFRALFHPKKRATDADRGRL